jgi:hypothetical protein
MRLENISRRIYFVDAPFTLKDALKNAGAHWDTDRRQWWIDGAQKALAESLVAEHEHDSLYRQRGKDGRYQAFELCDACNKPTNDVLGRYTDDEVCQGSDGPAARARCSRD